MINAIPTQLRKAANILEKIQLLEKELSRLISGLVQPATKAPKKREMSAAGRAAIVAAARARWAKAKGKAPKKKISAQGLANIRAGVAKRMAAQGKAVQKPKIQRSAAWRAALSAAAKARWAKAKKAGKSRW